MDRKLLILGGAALALWYLLRNNGGGGSSSSGVLAGKIGSDVNNTDTLGLGLAALGQKLQLGSSLYLDSPDGSVSVNPQVTGYRLDRAGSGSLWVPVETLATNNGKMDESNPWYYLTRKIETGWTPFVVYSDGSDSRITPP